MSHAAPEDLDYRLGAVLGQGAVATVVRVHDREGRVYAGKALHASHGQDEAAVQRFVQEAELLAGLKHQNLVELHGVATIEGQRVLLMELVEGPTLEQLIAREAPLAEDRIVALGRGVAAGLSEAHGAGIIHRDLKPANILVAEAGEVPKIADFGMARATSFAGVDRSAMAILGTPDYMAPESLDPLAVDPRSDLYALGCILFEMATGRPPYTAATPFGVLQQHREAPIPAVPKDYSDDLRALIQSLLAKSPADRPQAAATVAAALARLRANEAGAALAPLALASGEGPAARASCAGCGHPLILEIGACMNCGLVTARIERGECTLLITGPGEPGDKLDSNLRARLVEWIKRNPGLQMEVGSLGKTIPRMPFTLTSRVSQASAEAVGASLKRLGLEFEVVQGGALRSQAMRKKTTTMAGRAAAILAAMAGVFAQAGVWILVLAPVILLGLVVGVGWQATRRKTTAAPLTGAALPPAMSAAVRRVERALPAIDTPRHRHGLRAAVSRALALSRSSAADPETSEELAAAVDLATVAAGRLSSLDAALQERDLREPSAEERAMLHERDRWAARLLDLTATLDAFQARLASARAGASPKDATQLEDPLESLRLRVEALEEIRQEVESS